MSFVDNASWMAISCKRKQKLIVFDLNLNFLHTFHRVTNFGQKNCLTAFVFKLSFLCY